MSLIWLKFFPKSWGKKGSQLGLPGATPLFQGFSSSVSPPTTSVALWRSGLFSLSVSVLQEVQKLRLSPARRSPVLLMAELQVLAAGSKEDLVRPCVDCGLSTGCYCDWCLAASRDPKSEWVPGQHTPLCTKCDNLHGMCHYCRGIPWCTPFQHPVVRPWGR